MGKTKQAFAVYSITIDEKEYLRLGCLLEELFPEAKMQMISSVINPAGVSRGGEFARKDEYLYIVMLGNMSTIRQRLAWENQRWIQRQT